MIQIKRKQNKIRQVYRWSWLATSFMSLGMTSNAYSFEPTNKITVDMLVDELTDAHRSRYLSGDVDGNGVNDLIKIFHDDVNIRVGDDAASSATVWLRNGATGIQETTSISWVGAWSDVGASDDRHFLMLDVNGDQTDEIVEIWQAGGGANASAWKWNGEKFVWMNQNLGPAGVGAWSDRSGDESRRYLGGDFNGDGREDLIEIWKSDRAENATEITIWASKPDRLFAFDRRQTINHKWVNTNQPDTTQYFVDDIDNDGVDDLISIEKEAATGGAKATLYKNKNGEFQNFAMGSVGNWVSAKDASGFYLLDANGNGKVDIVSMADNRMSIWEWKDETFAFFSQQLVGYNASPDQTLFPHYLGLLPLNNENAPDDLFAFHVNQNQQFATLWQNRSPNQTLCNSNKALADDLIQSQSVFVSVSGNDENSGLANSPVATVSQAQCIVRNLRSAGVAGTIRVKIAAGDYKLTDTVVFGLADGGDGNNHTVYEAADPNNKPVFHSDVSVQGWERVDAHPFLNSNALGHVYSAPIPEELGRIYTLHADGVMLPNSMHSFSSEISFQDENYDFNANPLKQHLFTPDKVMEELYPELTSREVGDIELGIYPRQKWMYSRAKIKDFKSSEHDLNGDAYTTDVYLRMQSFNVHAPHYNHTSISGRNPILIDRPLPTGMTSSIIHREDGIRLFNSLTYLQEGEWAVDTREGKIYYWPEGGNIQNHISAPALRELFRIEGIVNTQDCFIDQMNGFTCSNLDVPVKNIHFKNLVFTRAERGYHEWGEATTHSEQAIYDKDNAALRFRGAENITVDGVEIYNTSGNGIRLDLHSQNISIVNSHIHHVGKTGIAVIGYGPGIKNANKNNLIENNNIHDMGLLHRMGQAILLTQTQNTKVLHNKIYNTPFNGISITGFRYGVGSRLYNIPALGEEMTPQAPTYEGFIANPEYQALRVGDIPWFLRGRVAQGEPIRSLPALSMTLTQGIEVAYNELSNVATDLGDTNAIYINTTRGYVEQDNAWPQPGTPVPNPKELVDDDSLIYVHHNYIHSMPDGEKSTAIRADFAQLYAKITHNILYDLENEGGIDFAKFTEVVNNYIVDVRGSKNNGYHKYYLKLHQDGGLHHATVRNNVVLNLSDKDTHTIAGVKGPDLRNGNNIWSIREGMDIGSNLYFRQELQNEFNQQTTCTDSSSALNNCFVNWLNGAPVAGNEIGFIAVNEDDFTTTEEFELAKEAHLKNEDTFAQNVGLIANDERAENYRYWWEFRNIRDYWSRFDRGVFNPNNNDQYADPLFLALGKQPNGFVLSANSPVHDMGIEPLDVMEMGLKQQLVEFDVEFMPINSKKDKHE
ncbi:right-handed parallel beta-helix repeat-containing protein [Aestuariibacter sp. AA17]|uniref:Right-handed parallel beta-helix repeat-containing protein n=1 Tax=Fluctibacter corallii TaxID=2984329 RepID=A0ABT3ABQ4_9ALTE|nr:right-handed parallel beta-helix repeat-containing protein [Aestuariibacter sp. AA17]MCV2886106.1 right-handed parallel beta-helix repeat-containing protein [Aestuariibacter sp. AA17]